MPEEKNGSIVELMRQIDPTYDKYVRESKKAAEAQEKLKRESEKLFKTS
ncbi:MAG: hypothetical protein K9L17_14150 [Clostridiales bacterium]|nr:hypothetical protein [Clostridiales bacterium]MCF8023812.1 hypothetical protein [Clostridiales bacterium]